MENMIKVSIIMPVYNSGKYLKTAVESILNQSLKKFELILVDDGSIDGSSERCDEYARKDERIVVIHQKNGGICAARNAALKVARGEFIAFSDHDDEYLLRLLEDNYYCIKKSGVDIVKFGCCEIVFSEKGKELRRRKFDFRFMQTKSSDMGLYFWQLWRNNVLNCVWDGIFRRSFLEQHSIRFNPYYQSGGEDIDFLWHCVGCGASIELNRNIYYNHYIRMGISTSSKYSERNIQMIFEHSQMLLELIKPLQLNFKAQPVEYTYFWLQSVLGALCHTIAHPKCNLSYNEKVNLLLNLQNFQSFHSWILDVSPWSIIKLASMQYALLLWLYKHKYYKMCVKLYEWRNLLLRCV